MIRRSAGRLVLRVARWRPEGSAPNEQKYVLIAAPHTSNWDLLYLLALSFYFDVKVSWLGKDSLFRGPIGFVLRRFGGVPVPRGQRSGMVEALVEEFDRAESLVIVVPPEATRSSTDHWKSGFCRIAVAAQVPIVCGYLDYAHRVGGFGQVVWPSNDLEGDMAIFRSFYADKQGKFPDQVGEVRLRATDAATVT